jgi:hypothetical protein
MAILYLFSWLCLLFSKEAFALSDSRGPSSSPNILASQLHSLVSTLRQAYPHVSQGRLNIWELVQIMAVCSILPGLFYFQRRWRESKTTSWAPTQVSHDSLPNGRKSVDINGKTPILWPRMRLILRASLRYRSC